MPQSTQNEMNHVNSNYTKKTNFIVLIFVKICAICGKNQTFLNNY